MDSAKIAYIGVDLVSPKHLRSSLGCCPHLQPKSSLIILATVLDFADMTSKYPIKFNILRLLKKEMMLKRFTVEALPQVKTVPLFGFFKADRLIKNSYISLLLDLKLLSLSAKMIMKSLAY